MSKFGEILINGHSGQIMLCVTDLKDKLSPLQTGDSCRVLNGVSRGARRHWGAVVQVEETPNKNHPYTYKVRNWVTRDHSFTMFLARYELEKIES